MLLWLKYNYKHFIGVKGFYWQLHEVYSKSQYLQRQPIFFKTSTILPGMLSINFWATSWQMAAHYCVIDAWNLSDFVGICLSTRFLKIDHKFSVRLRTGEFPRHGPKPFSYHFCFIARCSFMLEKALCSSPNCSWMVGRSCSRRMLWHYFIHACVLRQNSEWAHFLSWETAPHMNSLWILYCWHDKGLMVAHLSVSPWCFSWNEVASLLPFLAPGHPPKVFAHCACRCTHTCLLPFLSKLYAGGAQSHSWIYFCSRSWCLLDFVTYLPKKECLPAANNFNSPCVCVKKKSLQQSVLRTETSVNFTPASLPKMRVRQCPVYWCRLCNYVI